MERFTVDVRGPVHGIDYGGEGRLVLLVHGLGGSSVNWVDIGGSLTRFGQVLAPDLPGFGRTPPAGRSAAVRGLADFLAEFIKARTDRPATVVGNSMGALAAMLLAGEHPRLTEKMILIDPPAPGGDLRSLNPVWAATMLAYFIPGVNRALMAWVYRGSTLRQRTADGLRVLAGDGSQVSDETVRLHLETVMERSHMPWVYQTYFKAYRSIFRQLLPAWKYDRMARRITCPVLLMHGTADSVVPFRAAARLAGKSPDWDFAPLAGAGHIAMLETPRLFLELASDFLSRPASGGLPPGGVPVKSQPL